MGQGEKACTYLTEGLSIVQSNTVPRISCRDARMC
jgi:hypothetical protein